jgi:hypothetical protein
MLVECIHHIRTTRRFGDIESITFETASQKRSDLCVIINDKDMIFGHFSEKFEALEMDSSLGVGRQRSLDTI